MNCRWWQCVAALLAAAWPHCGCVVPRQCAQQLQAAGGRPVRCCPSACGGPRRGSCEPVRVFKEKEFLGLRGAELQDDRLDWPLAYFSHLCSCRGRYFGVACEGCWFGWRGPSCRQRDLLVRRNITSFTGEERRKLRLLLQLARNVSSEYRMLDERLPNGSDPLRRPLLLPGSVHFYLVHLHFFAQRGSLADGASCSGAGADFNFNHRGNNFLAWHRYFMMVWERLLQRIAAERLQWPNFSLPYWDWTDAGNCSVCTDELFGAEGADDGVGRRLSEGSPFSDWDEMCTNPSDWPNRCFGCAFGGRPRRLHRRWLSAQFPTRAELSFAMSRAAFYSPRAVANCSSFVLAMEGECGPNSSSEFSEYFYMHNRLHALVNGSFSNGATSPSDPLFLPHHAQVDRLLEAWLRRRGHAAAGAQLPPMQRGRPGHARDAFLVGFVPTVRAGDMIVATDMLGYTYDSFD